MNPPVDEVPAAVGGVSGVGRAGRGVGGPMSGRRPRMAGTVPAQWPQPNESGILADGHDASPQVSGHPNGWFRPSAPRPPTLIPVSGVLAGFTAIFIMVGVGFVLGRTGVLGEHAHEVLSRLVFFVATPALLFYSLVTTDLSTIFSSTLVVAGGSALAIGITYLVIAKLLLRREIPELVIGALASSYVNSVNLGVPIAIFVLDDASFIAPLLLFQILIYSPIALTTLDLTALERGSGHPFRDAVVLPLTNPIVIGGLAGVVISAIGWHPPQAILEPLKMLGNASVPGALLAFGLSLTGVAILKKGESPRRDVALATMLKMVAMPALVYVIARWGFGQTGHQLFAQVVIGALPTAQNVLVYATRYRRGEVFARDTALVTTLASIPVIAVIAWLLA